MQISMVSWRHLKNKIIKNYLRTGLAFIIEENGNKSILFEKHCKTDNKNFRWRKYTFINEDWLKEKLTGICKFYLEACTVGYNDFDVFLENEEHRPFDKSKIKIEDTFAKYVFWFFEPFLRIWL